MNKIKFEGKTKIIKYRKKKVLPLLSNAMGAICFLLCRTERCMDVILINIYVSSKILILEKNMLLNDVLLVICEMGNWGL